MKVYELLNMTIGKYYTRIIALQENIVLYDERYGYGGDGRDRYGDRDIKDIDFIPSKKLLQLFI